MKLSLSSIAQSLDLPWEGSDVSELTPAIMELSGPGCISLATGVKFISKAQDKGVSALVVPPGVACTLPCIRAKMPRLAFARLLALFDTQQAPPPGIHATACVHPDAKIDPSATLGPHVVVEEGATIGPRTRVGANTFVGSETSVGADCDLGPNVTVYYSCEIGNRVRLKAGAVIGGQGFGFEWDGSQHVRVPHLGTVVLEDDVEIGSNSCVDRAKIHETRIEQGTKIDNLVQIAHNVRVGQKSVMAAQVGIAGSTQIGAGCIFGGQVGVIDNRHIGPGAIFSAGSAVMADAEGGQTYMGYPAKDIRSMRRYFVSQHRLPDLFARVRRLEGDNTTEPS